jgi:hypothetical protein
VLDYEASPLIDIKNHLVPFCMGDGAVFPANMLVPLAI